MTDNIKHNDLRIHKNELTKDISIIQKTIKYLISNKKTLIDYIILSIPALLLPTIWLRKGMMLASHESGIMLAYDNIAWLDISRYVWLDLGGAGSSNIRIVIGLPFHYFMSFLQILGFSPVLKEGIVFFITFVIGSFSMYYLTKMLVKGQSSRLTGVLAGLFYALNTWQIISLNRMSLMFLATPLIPLVMVIYIKGMTESKINWKKTTLFAFLIAFSIAAFAVGFVTLSIVIPILIASFFILYILTNIKNRHRIIHAIKFSIIMFIFTIALNAYWFFPVFIGGYGEVFANITSGLGEITYVSNVYNQLIDVIRLLNLTHSFSLLYPDYASGVLNTFWDGGHHPGIPKIDTPTLGILGVIGFTVPILAFSALLLKPKSKNVLYFSIISVIAIFLSIGSNPPFGESFDWLFLNIGAFQAVRSLFEKTGSMLAFGYSFLIPVTIASIYYRYSDINLKHYSIRNHVSKIFSISFTILLLGPYVFPLWTGDVYSHPWVESFEVEVPDYYNEANEWLSTQEGDYRVLVLPLNWGDGGKFNWEHGYTGAYPHYLVFNNKSFITSKSFSAYNKDVYDLIGRFSDIFNIHDMGKILGILNVRYVMIQGDIDYEFQNIESPEIVKNWLYYRSFPSSSQPSMFPLASNAIPITNMTHFDDFENFLDGRWVNNAGISSILMNSSVLKKNGNYSGKISFPNSERDLFIEKTWAPIDWSHNDEISLWVYGNNTIGGEFSFKLRSNVNGTLYWTKVISSIDNDFDGWRKLIIDISPVPHLESVDGLSIKLSNINQTGFILLDDMHLIDDNDFVLSTDLYDKQEGESSISLIGQSNSEGESGITLKTLRFENLQAKNFAEIYGVAGYQTKFDFWIKTNVTGNLNITIFDELNNPLWSTSNNSILSEKTNQWVQINLKLDEIEDNVDINRTDHIEVHLTGLEPNLTFLMKVDGPYIENFINYLTYPTNSIINYEASWGSSPTLGIDFNDSPTINSSSIFLTAVPIDASQSNIGNIGIKYTIPLENQKISWSNHTFLEFWVKSSQAGPLWVDIADVNGKHRHWDGRTDSYFIIDPSEINVWKQLSFRFDIPFLNKAPDDFDFDEINNFLIGLVGINKTKTTIKLSNITVHTPIEALANYVAPVSIFGPLEFYKLADRYHSDHIYIANNLVFANNMYTMFDEIEKDSFNAFDSAILLREKLSSEQINQININKVNPTYTPKISFEKLNPTKYIVTIDTTEPYYLVFSESYDAGWIAKINNKELSNKNHFSVNGYANMWYVDNVGTYDLIIEFEPQNLFNFTALFSILSFIVSITFLVLIYRKSFTFITFFRRYW